MTYFRALPTPRPLSPIDAVLSSTTVPEPSELQNILSSEDLSRCSSSHENEFQVWVNSRSEANAHQVNVTDWHFSSPAQDQKWPQELSEQINQTQDDVMLVGSGPSFKVDGWDTVDLGGPATEVVSRVIQIFIKGRYFGQLQDQYTDTTLKFPNSPSVLYRPKMEEEFQTFG